MSWLSRLIKTNDLQYVDYFNALETIRECALADSIALVAQSDFIDIRFTTPLTIETQAFGLCLVDRVTIDDMATYKPDLFIYTPEGNLIFGADLNVMDMVGVYQNIYDEIYQ